MAQKLTLKQAGGLTPEQAISLINGGIQFVDAVQPTLRVLFDKLTNFIASLGKNNPNSPKNVRLRLQALEAKDQLQKELNKQFEARLQALENAK
jgi:hypothetical protein